MMTTTTKRDIYFTETWAWVSLTGRAACEIIPCVILVFQVSTSD